MFENDISSLLEKYSLLKYSCNVRTTANWDTFSFRINTNKIIRKIMKGPLMA